MDDVLESTDALDGQVSDDEQPEPKAPAKPEKPGKEARGKSETVTLTKAEHEALKRDRDEARQSERYWAGLARGGKAPAAEEEEQDPDEKDDEVTDDSPDTLVDEFSTKGIAALVKRGMVTKKEARTMIERTATKIARQIVTQERKNATLDQNIMTEFPELRDQESEFFQITKAELNKLASIDPNAARSATALYSAAAIARAKLDAKKPQRRARDESRYEYEGDEDESDRPDDEEESDRRRRVAAQGGDRRRVAASREDDDDGLPPMARKILEGMHGDKSEAERMKLFRDGQSIIRNGGTPRSRIK